MRWLRRLSYGLVTIVIVIVAALVAYRQASLPELDGTLKLSGLDAPVDIVRDSEGIPHIYAKTDGDAYFALGFVHAQDRLWQMELNRRIAAGRVAEILGVAALDTDRFLRTLGIARNAAAIVANLDATTRHALDRYAAGVNANLERRKRSSRFTLPPEFILTGAPFPEAWTPADSVGWTTMMAWDLSTNWTSELMRMRLAQKLTKKQIGEFLPPYPGNPRVADGGVAIAATPDAPLATADYTALYRKLAQSTAQLSAAAAMAPAGFVEGMGSNNWVVAGSRTVSGQPLLANDPHLGLSAPSLWYLAHLSSPNLNTIGATLPGVPFVVLGRNDRIAWGYTNTGSDTQDLYIEALRNVGGGAEARTPNGWSPLATRTEILKVKGGADVTITVRESRHGPLISDVARVAHEAIQTLGDAHYAIAFQWAALRADDKTMQAGLAMNRATDWPTFIAALRDFHSPQQNIVYADVDGNIGFIAPGRVPVRKPDNNLKGQAPAPGWDARYDWDGFVAFDDLPQRFNPPNGRIVTANHKIVSDDYRPFITSEWAPPYRARRIEQLLDMKPKHDVASFAAIQADVRSLAALDVLPLLLRTAPSNERARAALGRLAAWDGTMAADRAEPAIFSAWMRELSRLVYADELGPELFADYWDQRTVFLANVLNDNGGQGRWCDDIATPEIETCAMMQTRALDLALADLAKRLGPNVNAWRWGALHPARSEHRPFARIAALGVLFDLRVAVGGDSNTINVGRYSIRDEAEPFVDKHGPSLRAIYDLADLEKSRFIQSTGQSGHRLSPYYASFADRWAVVESIPMTTRRADVEAGAIGTLRLAPR